MKVIIELNETAKREGELAPRAAQGRNTKFGNALKVVTERIQNCGVGDGVYEFEFGGVRATLTVAGSA